MTEHIQCSSLSISPGLDLFHIGPPIDKGPLPVVFYFALSGQDSLCLDPFNQPARFLINEQIRVVSLTLPGHEANLPATDALKIWAEDLSHGKDIIAETIDKASTCLDYLIDRKIAHPNKIASMGLSRGGLICSHFAAEDDRVKFLLQFAPLTDLGIAKDFDKVKDNPLVQNLHVNNLTDKIYDRHIKIYIGNRDTRVSTKACYSFVENLSEVAYRNKHRSPQIEMVISPSIGQHGHGTPPHIFQDGAHWLINCLHPQGL